MKILIYTDVHLSKTSSIVKSEGNRHSTRLENVIRSVEWAESLAETEKCNEILCLGDFFQKPDLTSYEITAVADIKWSTLPHKFLVGNHESGVKNLKYNSVDVLRKLENFEIISSPKVDFCENVRLVYIPYITESDRLSLEKYIYPHDYKQIDNEKIIVLSHNDVKGIQMGPVISKEGFDVSEIDDLCDMFLNGHLHNGTKFSKKGINLGNLTGQNFGEDAYKYEHGAFILDTKEMSLEFFENPYAFNFYQIDITSKEDFNKLKTLKNQAVASFKCKKNLLEEFKQELTKYSNIVASRSIIINEVLSNAEKESDSVEVLLTKDHLTQFKEFTIEKLGNLEIVNYEINKIIM